MKKILLTLAAGFISVSVFGQGAIVFATFGGGVTAGVTNTITGQRISGPGYLAQLYYGPVGGSEDAMLIARADTAGTIPNAATFGAAGPVTGYIVSSTGGGNRYVDTSIVAAGAITAFQIRAWEASLGNNWDAAYALWQSGPAGPVLGKSGIVNTITSASPTEAAKPLTGLASFTVSPVPEPGVLALGALGLVAVLWRRRQ
jgi:MYXO-CTERM domain-containing protein